MAGRIILHAAQHLAVSLQACALPKMHRCSDAASALSSAICRRSGHHQAKSTTPYPPSLCVLPCNLRLQICCALGSTGVLLTCLHNAFPVLPVVGLVDWNPSGVAILASYKMGSTRMGLESTRQACMISFCTGKPAFSSLPVWKVARASSLPCPSKRHSVSLLSAICMSIQIFTQASQSGLAKCIGEAVCV